MTAKTVEDAIALEAQKGADRVRAEQERWFRAGLEAAADKAGSFLATRTVEPGHKIVECEAEIRCLPVPEDV